MSWKDCPRSAIAQSSVAQGAFEWRDTVFSSGHHPIARIASTGVV